MQPGPDPSLSMRPGSRAGGQGSRRTAARVRQRACWRRGRRQRGERRAGIAAAPGGALRPGGDRDATAQEVCRVDPHPPSRAIPTYAWTRVHNTHTHTHIHTRARARATRVRTAHTLTAAVLSRPMPCFHAAARPCTCATPATARRCISPCASSPATAWPRRKRCVETKPDMAEQSRPSG
eukprot:scaffold85669_cov74-Phaeocystis_antarctica.AAC.3